MSHKWVARKRLVFDDQIATQVAAFNSESEIGSQFLVMVTAKPGQDLERIEAIVDEEIGEQPRGTTLMPS